jgi:tripartite-type tricarboxylate transporter receptor subunit TctC
VNAACGRVQGYDPVEGFACVTILLRCAFMLVVRADHPARDPAALLAMARQEPGRVAFGSGPGRVAFGSGGVGSSHHLTGEALCAAAGAQMTHVPNRRDAAGLTAVLAGDVPLMISTTVGAIGQLQGNALRALAVTSPQRSRRLPAVPAVAEAGLPGFVRADRRKAAKPEGVHLL